jgi:hypothetical protein
MNKEITNWWSFLSKQADYASGLIHGFFCRRSFSSGFGVLEVRVAEKPGFSPNCKGAARKLL